MGPADEGFMEMLKLSLNTVRLLLLTLVCSWLVFVVPAVGEVIEFDMYSSSNPYRMPIGAGCLLAMFSAPVVALTLGTKKVGRSFLIVFVPYVIVGSVLELMEFPFLGLFGAPFVLLWLLCLLGAYLVPESGAAPFGPGQCGCCGYDLTANPSGACPECGLATNHFPAREPVTRWRRAFLWLVGLVPTCVLHVLWYASQSNSYLLNR
ncbi:MAG: hypothetical protein ACYSU7_00005 [Planctomycetota bacterium]|jgi:hypothetical protein